MAKKKYQNKKQNQEARKAEEARLIAAGLMEAPKSKKQLAEEERLAKLAAKKEAEAKEATGAKVIKEKPKPKPAKDKPKASSKPYARKTRKARPHADVYETNFGGKYIILRWIAISIVLGLVATIFIGVAAGTDPVQPVSQEIPVDVTQVPFEQVTTEPTP